MPYFPPRAQTEPVNMFFLRAVSSIRWASKASLIEEANCPNNGGRHKLDVCAFTTRPELIGEQSFYCPDRLCENRQLRARRLEADELKLVTALYKLFTKYLSAYDRLHVFIQTNNDLDDPVRDQCFSYWMKRAEFLHCKEEFMEEYQQSKNELAQYFERENKVEMTKADRKLVKSAFQVPALPQLLRHCPESGAIRDGILVSKNSPAHDTEEEQEEFPATKRQRMSPMIDEVYGGPEGQLFSVYTNKPVRYGPLNYTPPTTTTTSVWATPAAEGKETEVVDLD